MFLFYGSCRHSAPLLNKGGSLLTLTYESSKIIPNYNVMGVCKSALEQAPNIWQEILQRGLRVNAISAGPIKTLAASAIGDAFLYNGMKIILYLNAMLILKI